MISKLGILNFQSIEQLMVECGPITVFVGESDSGKSAVVRALYAAAFNDYPSDHVRVGAQESLVAVSTEAGSVWAKKGKAQNSYELKPSGAPLQRWDRVGRDVPAEVADLLGWKVVELDDGTKFAPSIQRQFDGPFLVAESPSKVAKVLGSLTNISVLFAAIREGTLQERRAKQRADAALEQAQKLELARGKLEAAVEAAQDRHSRAVGILGEAESVLEDLVATEGLERAVTGSLAALEGATAVRLAAEKVVFDLPDLGPAFEEIERLRLLEADLKATASLVVEASTGRTDLEAEVSQWLSDMEAFRYRTKVCPCCGRLWEEAE